MSFPVTPLWSLAAALIATVLACPVVRRAAIHFNLYDRPDAGLKPHDVPIPHTGGVAMFVGWLAALAASAMATDVDQPLLPWIAAAGTILTLTGLVDDVRHLSPRLRLAIMAATTGLLLVGGVGRRTAAGAVEPLRDWLPAWAVGEPVILFISAAITFVILAGAMNATNLIDGLDGLAAGITGLGSLGLILVSLSAGDNATLVVSSRPLQATICAALFGMCAGFLLFNWNPASIFMGDSGSLLLGFNVAIVLILLAETPAPTGSSTWRWLSGGVLVVGFPVLDTAVAITRRSLRGRPLFTGDRSHLYDQLRDRGRSVRRTVLTCYLIGMVFLVLGVAAVGLPTLLLLAVLIAVPGIASLLVRRFGLLRVDDAAGRSASPPGG